MAYLRDESDQVPSWLSAMPQGKSACKSETAHNPIRLEISLCSTGDN
jgi:hypothetical protein